MQHSVFRPRSSEGDSDGFQRQCGHRKFPSSAMAYLQLVNPVQERPGNVYSYYRAGDISNLNPPQGEMAGGTRVTIETTDLDATIVAVGLGVGESFGQGWIVGRKGKRISSFSFARAGRQVFFGGNEGLIVGGSATSNFVVALTPESEVRGAVDVVVLAENQNEASKRSCSRV